MSAVAVFHCHPNSHPFQARQISLQEKCKIGRSVARSRPASDNAVFDCKVLSRNHALLWYENGVFYLQDTKSSNGTFVSNQRLSKGSEESEPCQIYSGDVLQFGVDVMENSKKVTHGCIIATVSLFHPDGREVKPSHSSAFGNQTLSPGGATYHSQELYQLTQYLQEALHREQMLENKLATLQRLVHQTQESSESGWQALIDEDRLLSKLEVLENQLLIYSKNQTEDTLRQELVALTEDKSNYETTAKESMKRALQEKLDAVRKVSELERSLSNTEDECSHLKTMCENSQKELEDLAEKQQKTLQEMAELHQKFQEAEIKHFEEEEAVEKEKAELQAKIDSMVKEENILTAKVESLQADNDFTKEQLSNMKARMKSLKEQHAEEKNKFTDTEKQGEQAEVLTAENGVTGGEDQLKEKLRTSQEEIEKYKALLEESDNRLHESREVVKSLQVQQNVSNQQKEGIEDLTKDLKDQIKTIEDELNEFRQDTGHELSETTTDPHNIVPELTNHRTEKSTMLGHSHSLSDLDRVKELLAEARESQRKTEAELVKCKSELEESKSQAKLSADETEQLKKSLSQAQEGTSEQSQRINNLQEQLQDARQAASQGHSEAEQLRLKVRTLEEELELEQISRGSDSETTYTEIHRQAVRNKAEFNSLKEECANLRRRIANVEEEMKVTRREKSRLDSDYESLQVSYRELEAAQQNLRSNETAWRINSTDAQKEAEQTKQELLLANNEIATLKDRCAQYGEEITQMRDQLDTMTEEYRLLSDKSKAISACSAIPILFLLFAFIIAFYQPLAFFTATSS